MHIYIYIYILLNVIITIIIIRKLYVKIIKFFCSLPTKQEKFSKTTLQIFNILESFGWIVSFVISTNKFEESRSSMTG